MDIANDENALVVGTGDLSEIALGWCTYNADHMSMYNVNSTLSKTLIRQMLSYFAKTTYNVVEKQVIYDILDTPVSPELLPADADGNITQKTEESVGSYDLNDFFLYNMIYMGFTPSKTYRLACIAFEKKIENNAGAVPAGNDSPESEAVLALAALGYSSKEALKAVRKAAAAGTPADDVEALLKAALREL
jgi:NAD+ synthase (glutamine-hydrolysing)